MTFRVGGAGANAGLAFVETAMPVRLMGCVGSDQLGRWMREQVVAAGLTDELTVLGDAPTGLTVALESAQRDRTFLTYLGVNAGWGPELIAPDALRCDNLLLCDYFVASALQGEAARVLQADSGRWVVVTLGARGCLAVGPDETELTATAPVVVAADTTGAGDAFNAGLVHALSEGAGWPQALRDATRFASTIIARPPGDRHRRRQFDGSAVE